MNCSKLLYPAVFLLTTSLVVTQKYQNISFADDNAWVRLGRVSGFFLKNCGSWLTQEQDIFSVFQSCLQELILAALLKTFESDHVEILDGIEFVKIKNATENFSRKMDNGSEESDWENRLTDAVADVLETHVLKIHLENFVKRNAEASEARLHHHHRRGNLMTSLLMFGLLAMGMLLIPMGFKFLTVLGAKALLLAKMALILTSIQGLKKVATSGFDYGLYHSPPANPWHHDRHGLENIPDEQLEYFHHKHLRS